MSAPGQDGARASAPGRGGAGARAAAPAAMAAGRVSYRARKRWALVVLLIGLPLYVVAAVTLVGLFDRPGIAVELLIYIALGIIWALPFRALFRGLGRPDPAAPESTTEADTPNSDTPKGDR